MLISYAHTEFCAELRRSIQANDYQDVEAKFDSYLRDLLSYTGNLFFHLTGDHCFACIKLLRASSEDNQVASALADEAKPSVWTFRRDPKAAKLRQSTDDRYGDYEYNQNAAFSFILDRHHEPDYFICNDLVEAEEAGRYWNENEHYRQYYNATAVVPIVVSSTVHGGNGRCMGFLCIDNMNGGFDTRRCVHILNGIAADLYYSIRTAGPLLRAKAGDKVNAGRSRS